MPHDAPDELVAVVGMACRFPGATSLAQYWDNVAAGVESLTWLTDEELVASGVPAAEFRHPDYVRAAFVMDDMETYDAAFFGDTPREAQIRDPQVRWFLETCYAATQDSGYDPAGLDGLVAVVGGMSNNYYGERYVQRNAVLHKTVGDMAISVGSNPDYLATTVSYRLGFRGPSLTVQTACSSSLVAIHQASQMLRSGECDYALAGGVEIELPDRIGHRWMDGNIYTRSGHIRPFDVDASGTMFSSGVGVVALKRLADAIDDRDHVYAVLRGSAVNNDGGDRAGFTAPGVEGQAQLIVEALAAAEVHPDSIGYVEAHATGTLVGDPIEVAGLDRAYRAAGARRVQSCPIGSVKGNVGHLGPASGVAGLIKTCLALENELIPPTVNYTSPNPRLNLEQSPFFVADRPLPWTRVEGQPRRAGVSSFGIGGTNVHVVVEEAPAAPRPETSRRRHHVLPLSARTATAADASVPLLGEALARRQPDLAAVSATLRGGRPTFAHRRAVVADDLGTAVATLTDARSRVVAGTASGPRPVAMVFPGQGAQYPGMGRELFDNDPVFRGALEECAALLAGELETPLLDLLYPADPTSPEAAAVLAQTRHCQPALFSVGYAMATTLGSLGVQPSQMIGHSIGEYVAACLAGVMDLPDALRVVAARGRLMQRMEPGAMLAVQMPAFLLSTMLPEDTEIAAVNGPEATVLAGPHDAIDAARQVLEARGVTATPLVTSHAFHSRLMEPCLAEFAEVLGTVPLRPAKIPFVSNVTGTWITDVDCSDPGYWVRHLRSPVLFADGVATLCSDPDLTLLEVGPGGGLGALVEQSAPDATGPVIRTFRHPRQQVDDDRVLAEAVAALWCAGVPVDWAAWDVPQPRVSLPPYPFERLRHWADPDPVESGGSASGADDEDEWPLPAGRCTFVPRWREAPPTDPPADHSQRHYLLLDPGHPVLAALADRLRDAGAELTVARSGPGETEDLDALLAATTGRPVTDIVDGWCVSDPAADPLDPATVRATVDAAFYHLLHLAQALSRRDPSPIRLYTLSSNMQEVSGTEALEPGKATLLGPTMLAEREVPQLRSRSVDLALPSSLPATAIADQLLAELSQTESSGQVGWRGRKRWELDYAMAGMDEAPDLDLTGGVFLITGGLGALGLCTAEELAAGGAAAVVLTGRSDFLPREQWEQAGADPATDPRTVTVLQRLLAIEASGTQVRTARCDVADETQLAAVVASVHDELGTIRGVFHAAGVAGGAMLAVREYDDAAAVLAPKVDGTLALDRVLGDEADFLVLYSSLTAVTGAFGQVDYCAANNFMDSYARMATQRGRRVLSLGWTQWTEAGMSADKEADAPKAFRDLQTGTRFEPAAHPLLDRRVVAPGADVEFSTVLAPGQHWISAEHRLDGEDIVVGTSLVEMVSAAYAEGVGGDCDVRDVIFISPIGVVVPTEVRVRLSPAGEEYDAVVTAGPAGSTGATERMRCRLAAATREEPVRHDLDELRRRCSRESVTADQLGGDGSLIEFGAHWQDAIRHTQLGDRESLSLVEMPEELQVECGRYRLHPALLDIAVAETNYAEDRIESGESYLPFSYGRLTAHEPLPPRFWVHTRHLSELGAEFDRMTVTLMHEDGTEIALVQEYTERRVDPVAIKTAVTDVPEATAEPTTAERSIDDVSITPELGRDVLRRVLHWQPGPHVIVVPEGIHRNLRRTRALTIDVVQQELGSATVAAGARTVDTEYQAPETGLEKVIAELWEATLGLDAVGIDDGFFELGGNSLVAVQLAARIRDTLEVDMPIAILFDHPTVRLLASYLTAEIGDPS
jgi:phthiocerol/phenolphthiocerol synthesis type-I polyketide synthase E